MQTTTTLSDLSQQLSTLAPSWKPRLFHISGQGISNRSALLLDDQHLVSLARSAQADEQLSVLNPEGSWVQTRVVAYDPASGLVVLKLAEAVKNLAAVKAHDEAATLKALAVGSLGLRLAYASPDGLEAQFENVRCLGGEFRWGGVHKVSAYFQTSGNAWPGFGAGIWLGVDGSLLGMVVQNADGNSGMLLPWPDIKRLAETLIQKGSPKRMRIGIRTQAVKAGPDGHGLLVSEVENDSPAHKAGLLSGDILLHVNDSPLRTSEDLLAQLSAWSSDAWLGSEQPQAPVFKYLRAGAVQSVQILPVASA